MSRKRMSLFRAIAGFVCAITAVAACGVGTRGPDPSTTTYDVNVQTSGGIVRVVTGGHRYDLSIMRMTPSSDTTEVPLKCLNQAGPVQFDLNWSPANRHDALPEVITGIETLDGTVLTLGGAATNGCRLARSFIFAATPVDSQLVFGAALPAKEEHATVLRVTVNGKSILMHLRPSCEMTSTGYATSSAPCADNPLIYDPSNGYSALLTL